MKRFTETTKWQDPWYRKLSSPAKQLWEYLRDNCDPIGLVEIDFGLVSADCGQKINESNLTELGDRVQRVDDRKLFLPKFIHFQYGALTETCPPHRSIIKLVVLHKLIRNGLHYAYPNVRVALPLRQDKTGMENDKTGTEGVQGEIFSEAPSLNPEVIYEAYPRKVGRPKAILSIKKAILKHGFDHVLAQTKLYASLRNGEDSAYTPHPATWFNQERYNDDPTTWKSNGSPSGKPNPRNFGIVGETTYENVKPRLQRELEEKKCVAEQVAVAP